MTLFIVIMACKVLIYVPLNEREDAKKEKGFSWRLSSENQTKFDVFYLTVPFRMREKVKALGAYYDNESHAWFVIRRQLIERLNYFSPKLAKSGDFSCAIEKSKKMEETVWTEVKEL